MTFEKYPQLAPNCNSNLFIRVQTLKIKTWKFHIFGAKYFFGFYISKYADDRDSLSVEDVSDLWKVSLILLVNWPSEHSISSKLEK